MSHDIPAMAQSPGWATRVEAAERLRRDRDPAALPTLLALLADDDLAVVHPAAAALLDRDDAGWVAVLSAAWTTEEDGRFEAIRSALIDRAIDGEDIQARLEDHVDVPRTKDSSSGALELLMHLGFRPLAQIEEDGED